VFLTRHTARRSLISFACLPGCILDHSFLSLADVRPAAQVAGSLVSVSRLPLVSSDTERG
jgi:hypothetical protein